ncbi:MAG: dockerin type I domain-containing protein, partial [Planctomycetota bacterium]
VIILAFSLNLTEKPAPTTLRPGLAKAPAADIDQNGRVDILDAFKLARQIELAGSTEAILDINGDGLVNRDDVDMVALAAVRLDKGV